MVLKCRSSAKLRNVTIKAPNLVPKNAGQNKHFVGFWTGWITIFAGLGKVRAFATGMFSGDIESCASAEVIEEKGPKIFLVQVGLVTGGE
jgi:hypothetical protein